MIMLLIATWAVITPVRQNTPEDRDTHPIHSTKLSGPAKPSNTKPVTFQQVSEKSQAALVTTAAYVRQEKDKLRARMGVVLQKLDQEIARLQTAQAKMKIAKAEQNQRTSLQQRLVDLQDAKQSLLQLQSDLPASTQSTWNRIKANWNRLEPNINARIQS
jgi:Skp family chaperone for outer membrane proteins